MVEKPRPNSVAVRKHRPLIVIPCLNEAAHIAGLLRQLEGPAERLDGQIVVVDGGSTDATPQIVARFVARSHRVTLLHNPDRVQSAGINQGVAWDAGRSSHLIRLDAHSHYPDDFCEVLMTQARSVYADAIVVSMIAHGAHPLQRINAAVQNSAIGNGGARHRLTPSAQYVDHGHHALIRIDAFKSVGGYDPSFSHNEDAELDHRLRAAGGRIWLTSSVAISYIPRVTLPAIARQYFNFGAGRARNLLKHRLLPRLRQTTVIGVLPAVLLASFASLHWSALVPALIWATACQAAGVMIALHHKRPAFALCGPVAMVMHLTWSTGFWLQVLRQGAAPRQRAV